MEPFVDFGLFELIGLAAVALMSRDERVRRQLRDTVSRAMAKLGRCVRCMVVAGGGLVVSWTAMGFLDQHVNRWIRFMVLAVLLAFAALSALHLLAILYRSLSRVEEKFAATMGGGCNCNGQLRNGRRARRRAEHSYSRK